MDKNKKNLLVITFAIVEIISIFAVVFTSGELNEIICKFSIVLNLLFAILFTIKYKSNSLIVFALLFTALSDSMLVTYQNLEITMRTAAMISFNVAQLLYFFEIRRIDKKTSNICLIFRIAFISITILITAILLKDQFNLLIVVSAFYFINLIFNLIESAIHIKKIPVFFLGFIFFFICDLSVAISSGFAIGVLTVESNPILKVISDLLAHEWIYYLIAQFFLVMGIKSKKFEWFEK